MKLRFAVHQGESLRQGINCNSSTTHVDVDPTELPQDERNLLADRMIKGDNGVYELFYSNVGKPLTGDLICANTPDYAGLIQAVRENQKAVEIGQAKLKAA